MMVQYGYDGTYSTRRDVDSTRSEEKKTLNQSDAGHRDTASGVTCVARARYDTYIPALCSPSLLPSGEV